MAKGGPYQVPMRPVKRRAPMTMERAKILYANAFKECFECFHVGGHATWCTKSE